ncbi:MAG: hypothetical protein ACKO2H_06490, partial [Bacteroidota bacterium]
NGAVTNAKLGDTSVTGGKINRMGATNGQILKWNGTTWAPANDTTGKYFTGPGIAISNDSIINTGDRDSSNDVTITRVSANGEVLGKFDSLYIKDGVVSTVKLANGAVTAAKLNQMGATNGQILKWNGTTWAPALDSGKVYKAGLGISISNDSIINTGTINFFTASRDTVGANLSKAAHRWIASSTSNPSIDIVLSPKGSGAFLVNLPDNFVSGGDKRGNYAVDLQLARGESADVAKSSFSNILGGYSNEISSSSDYSKIGGGSDNKITTSTYAAIIGGWFNSIKTGSNYSSIGGGSLNTIQKQYGTIAGGTENNVNALYGTISGGGLNVIDPAGYVGTIGG